jgi:sucrose-6F-phosphate phosphohydrolase
VKLLVSDLDGTLLGDDRALETFSDRYRRSRGRIGLVYSSGRFIDSIRSSIEAFHLPEPAAIIGGVGTEIYDNTAGRRIVSWPPIPFGWNPDTVRSTCSIFGELREQPQEFVSPYKVSYYGMDLDEAFLAGVVNELTQVGQDSAIVYSSSRDLDILPAGSNKGSAIAYLAKRWQFSCEDVIVAGDSGNDRDMFCQGFRGIVVGNAQPELKRLRDERIYHATERYAAGIIEGLRFWLDDF